MPSTAESLRFRACSLGFLLEYSHALAYGFELALDLIGPTIGGEGSCFELCDPIVALLQSLVDGFL